MIPFSTVELITDGFYVMASKRSVRVPGVWEPLFSASTPRLDVRTRRSVGCPRLEGHSRQGIFFYRCGLVGMFGVDFRRLRKDSSVHPTATQCCWHCGAEYWLQNARR